VPRWRCWVSSLGRIFVRGNVFGLHCVSAKVVRSSSSSCHEVAGLHKDGITFKEKEMFLVSPSAVGFGGGIAEFLHLNLWNLNGYINNFPNLNMPNRISSKSIWIIFQAMTKWHFNHPFFNSLRKIGLKRALWHLCFNNNLSKLDFTSFSKIQFKPRVKLKVAYP